LSTEIKVTFTGPIFQENPGKLIREAIIQEGLSKLEERVNRPRKRAGWRNNPLTTHIRGEGEIDLIMVSPTNHPRQSGAAWIRFINSLVQGSFWQRQIRAITKRIVEGLG
jgi:hypothetical protein